MYCACCLEIITQLSRCSNVTVKIYTQNKKQLAISNVLPTLFNSLAFHYQSNVRCSYSIILMVNVIFFRDNFTMELITYGDKITSNVK